MRGGYLLIHAINQIQWVTTSSARTHIHKINRFLVVRLCEKYIYNSDMWNMMHMRSALFYDITQRWVVVLYRRFGTIYRSHLQGSRSRRRKAEVSGKPIGPILNLEDGTDRLSRNVDSELPLNAASYAKSADLIYIAAEAWNQNDAHSQM